MPLDGTTPNLEQEFEALTGKVKGFAADTKRFADQATKEIKGFGELSAETKAKADEALTRIGEATARLGEIEQRLARRGRGDDAPAEQKSLGEWVVDDERVKAMTSGTRGSASVRVEYKDITSATSTLGATTSPSNSMIVADRRGPLMLPQRALTVRDLIAPGSTSSNAIEYAKEVAFTNNAAPVAEGATKPKSDITFDLTSVPVRTIAHIAKASRQVLDDAPQLRSIIDQRLRYGLQYVEEVQLLSGAGTGANLYGIIPQATAFSAPITVGSATFIDNLRLAVLQAQLTNIPPDGIVLHPSDWARVELWKNGQSDYMFGGPQGSTAQRLWGLPVVATQAMTLDKALVGSFRGAAQIFDRMAIEVLLSTENSDDFEKNLVTIRAEHRLALAVYRPTAFVYSDLGFVA
jgi:HK97 family phage major capsid protein